VNLHTYATGDPLNRSDVNGLWYVDIGGSIGGPIIGTIGVIIGPHGVHVYYGGGLGTPGFGVTYSPNDPDPGFNAGITFSNGNLFQYGYGPSGTFAEAGGGVPGAAATGFWVTPPLFRLPWSPEGDPDCECPEWDPECVPNIF
jgi:hypothetical protein